MSFSFCSTFCEFISLWHLCIWLLPVALGNSSLRNGHLSVSWQCLRKFKQQSRGIDWLFQFLLNFFRARSYLALFSSFLSPPIPTRGCIIFLMFWQYFAFAFHPTTHPLWKVQYWKLEIQRRWGGNYQQEAWYHGYTIALVCQDGIGITKKYSEYYFRENPLLEWRWCALKWLKIWCRIWF